MNVTGPEFDIAPQAIGVIRPVITPSSIDPVQSLVSIVAVEEHSGNERGTETLRKNQVGHFGKGVRGFTDKNREDLRLGTHTLLF